MFWQWLYFSYYMDVCVYMCHIWELCHIYWRENMTLKRIFWTFLKLKHHFGIRTDYWYFVLTRNINCQNWERTIPRTRFQIWPQINYSSGLTRRLSASLMNFCSVCGPHPHSSRDAWWVKHRLEVEQTTNTTWTRTGRRSLREPG